MFHSSWRQKQAESKPMQLQQFNINSLPIEMKKGSGMWPFGRCRHVRTRSIEEPQHFTTDIFSTSFFMIHDSSRSSQHNITKLQAK